MRQLLFILFVFTINAGFAQKLDSVRLLSAVTIQDQRLEVYDTGGKVETLEGISIQQQSFTNLSDFLRRNSAINLRSYGLGGLSTISFRGTGSSQSVVQWEGINLQSPSNGSLDLSLVPVSFVDKVILQYGGGSAQFGSAVMGGVVHLSTRNIELNTPMSVSFYQQLGSFGSSYTGLNLSHSGINYAFKLRGFRKSADNDFEFFNEFIQRKETQDNGGIDQEGLMAEVFYKFNENQNVTAKYWVQDNLIDLPKVKSQGLASVANQNDLFHRGTLQWRLQKNNFLINAKIAYVWHQLVYADAIKNINSHNLTKTLISEVTADYRLKPLWKIQSGVNLTKEVGEADGYRNFVPIRHRIAMFSSLKGLLFDKLETTISIRESYNNQDWSPFLPSLGLNYQFNQHYSLKAKVARSYRVPTFNDLYWWRGGNPDLRPERGTSIEFGSQQSYQIEGFSIENEVTIYSNYVHDWILWTPIEGYAWSPDNVQEVWSKGIEFDSKVKFRLTEKIRVHTSISYQLTDTRVEAIFDEKVNTLNKQMILTPIHSGSLGFNISRKSTAIGIDGNYTGKQFTDDNSIRGTLEDYLIWDMLVSQEVNIANKHKLLASFDLKNIFDHRYDVRKGYPMPGRNFNVSINYQFN
jgi:iron complex outermembrane receptor protein